MKEAISRLAFEDYVELLPNRCAIVSGISATEVIELLELRESSNAPPPTMPRCGIPRRISWRCSRSTITTERYRLSRKRLWRECDQRFHMAIAKATYNRQMYQTIEKVFTKLVRVSVAISAARLPDSLVQHTNILNAIREGNAEAARRYMSEHDQIS